MTWLDFAVLGVFALSIAWGVWRGLVREVFAVLGWVIAFLAANLLAGPLAEEMPKAIQTPELRLLAAFLAVFIGALFVTALIGLLLSKIVSAIGLLVLDRALGGLFGVARALLIVLAAALLAGLTGAPRQPFWRDSVSGDAMARAALALKPWLPQTFAERLRYD
ncbi:MAG: CvpA family protein [Burkholderiales bacterium]